MKLETIEKYENTYNLRIPENFRYYLLNISSETMGRYPYKLELNYEPELIFIHESKKWAQENEKDEYDEENLKTHTNGCTDDDYLCIKGPKYGNKGSYKWGGDYFSID